MTPNYEQLMSILRWALSVGGPLAAMLIARGQTPEQVTALSNAILTIVGALPPIVSFVMGLLAHTDSKALKVVAAMPDVTKIVTVPVPSDSVAAVVADPATPKVVAGATVR